MEGNPACQILSLAESAASFYPPTYAALLLRQQTLQRDVKLTSSSDTSFSDDIPI